MTYILQSPADLNQIHQLLEREFQVMCEGDLSNTVCATAAELCVMCTEQSERQFEQFKCHKLYHVN
jgi:hypothetical protein